jgi:hypothetical protein
MKTQHVKIAVKSIYQVSGKQIDMPSRMAKCTPDMYVAIHKIDAELRALNSELIISDLFRSYDMQLQAHLDYVNKKKSAYSPPPGGSMHEAGRAFDIDLGVIKKAGLSLQQFWDIANKYGVKQIIKNPDFAESESWHFDCRGSHQLVYDYYSSGKADNMKPYIAMAASAILSAGIPVDRYKGKEQVANIQFGLVRLGKEIGNVDGVIGQKSKDAIAALGIKSTDINVIETEVESMLQLKFKDEYQAVDDTHDEPLKPDRIIE